MQNIPQEYIEIIKVSAKLFKPKNEPTNAKSFESPPPNAYLLVNKYIKSTKISKPRKPVIAPNNLERIYVRLQLKKFITIRKKKLIKIPFFINTFGIFKFSKSINPIIIMKKENIDKWKKLIKS